MKHAREGGPVRYRARVQYDGTEFAGFQVQPGRRTVQGELERALAHLAGGRRIPISAAGRTDAGVHATGQVVAFTWDGDMPAKQLGPAIGALLPRDVAIGPLRSVALDFDPRRAAMRREYRYTIWNGPRSPMHDRFAYGLEDRLDVEAMQQAAVHLVGWHDFSAFGRVKFSAMRTLYEVRTRRQGHLVTIDVIGDAFLQQMVRSIVAALVRIGIGRATEKDLVDELRSPGRAFDGAIVPARGLCLRRVTIRPSRDDKNEG
ncbi:MAG: tRNA pseudouridine(38-40) synthase TruA [Chloroflexota bacterium]